MDPLGEMMARGATEGYCAGELEAGNAGSRGVPGPKLELQAVNIFKQNKTTKATL